MPSRASCLASLYTLLLQCIFLSHDPFLLSSLVRIISPRKWNSSQIPPSPLPRTQRTGPCARSGTNLSLLSLQLLNQSCYLKVVTSGNFSKDSTLALFVSGGLSYQIEHHLFPTMAFTYYPEIAPLVEKTCKEYGVNYVSRPSYWDSLTAHQRHLYVHVLYLLF